MGKVGKSEPAYNAFKGGRGEKTSSALVSALDDLNDKRPAQTAAAASEEVKADAEKRPEGKPKASKARKPKTPAKEVAAAPSTSGESPSRFAKRFQATRGEGAEYDAAALRLSAAVGSKIDFSKVTRTLWRVYLQHEEDIIRNVTEAERELGHPGTGDSVGLVLLEEDVAKLINRGLRLAARRPSNLD